MKRTLFILDLIIFSLYFSFSGAQNLAGYQKLRGAVMSTVPDDNYTRHAYNAFDTNEATSFMARDVSGWVGLDLGENFPIRKIRIYPMPDRNEQFVGAQFQGADNPDFNNPVTLFTVTQIPNAGEYVTYDISVNQTFRYVRCMNPSHRCSVAELEFYTDLNLQTIRYSELTNLPTIYLETDGQFDFVDKETYVPAKVAVSKANSVEIFDAQVRGRGNSSWDFMEKKSFKIKFNEKQRFLGMPAKAKNWTLIALAVDKTLLRNGLAFEMSKALGFEFTPSCVMVDVVLDGFYYGTFMASDNIDVDKNRVNIDKMTTSDVDDYNITGGYQLEIDAYADQEPVHFTTPRNVPFTVKSPDSDEILPVQKTWIENHINALENSLFTNTNDALEKYIDVESAVKYYLHSELSGNCDSYWCIPCYKKRGDDKLYFGPVWDYDQAFLTNERVPRYSETLKTNFGVALEWFRKIMQTDTAQTVMRRLWKEVKNDNLQQHLLDYLDENSALLQQSQALNFARWNSLNRKVWFEDALFNTYDEYIDFVKQYIVDRFTWFNDIAQERKAILPISLKNDTAQTWKYTFDLPATDWYTDSFDDSRWLSGKAPFGTEQNLQNTSWTTNQIFIRKNFYVNAEDLKALDKAFFYVWHDEDCEIYLNNELALHREGYITAYQYFDFDKNLLHEGWNTLAAKCTQTAGGQLIDVGIYVTPEEQSNQTNSVGSTNSAANLIYYVSNGNLILNGLKTGESVQLYGMDGKLLKQQKSLNSILQITLPARGIYLVRLQGKTIKVVY
jgi:hypothetical protein